MSRILRTGLVKMSELAEIAGNISIVRERIVAACAKRSPELQSICEQPRLVAVSKKKTVQHVVKAYEAGVEHFGENYVQELAEKAAYPEIENCSNIKFHFIGHLQKNKVSKLLSAGDKLFVIETIDSEGLAKHVNDAVARRNPESSLNVMLQINTSGEDSKSGADPESCVTIAKYIIEECKQLNFIGLMTIGSFEQSTSDSDENKDFQTLYNLREKVCKELDLERKNVELSMGMSADYEDAIVQGSTNVRVGSFIFGARVLPTQT
ncbi:Proline synthase co-transcribed bacterial protein [Orchesella cincta]|uniref:Pyridoxal phosphate homeostasis protein n=1 Tax=Orchesella cincta TaxID=48709 RepID=A0A1D2MIY4_ORCCI|nr:Proline synthase co-transcribed bacterial protein [Orchesella cincta]